jgi:hypothetical protein
MGLDLHPARRSDDPLYGDEDSPYWPGAPYPQWSYGGFDRFRQRLAEAEGFSLNEMAGFGEGFGEDAVRGTRSWDDVTTELAPLLNHSDCDGEMTPQECAAVLPRLREIITGWATAEPGDYDVQAGQALCEAMQLCAEQGVRLLFR